MWGLCRRPLAGQTDLDTAQPAGHWPSGRMPRVPSPASLEAPECHLEGALSAEPGRACPPPPNDPAPLKARVQATGYLPKINIKGATESHRPALEEKVPDARPPRAFAKLQTWARAPRCSRARRPWAGAGGDPGRRFPAPRPWASGTPKSRSVARGTGTRGQRRVRGARGLGRGQRPARGGSFAGKAQPSRGPEGSQ